MEIENNNPGSSLDNNIQIKTILVIEDILYVLKSIENILKEEGYYILTAMNGKDALEMFKNYSPDLVTIDQKLPDTSGTKLLEEINKMNLNKKPKIIFISANYDKDEIQNILLHNVNNYLIKPFKKNKLVEVVKELIGNP
jgi:two-component system, chemotaxis family, chemotaxis protein CheY